MNFTLSRTFLIHMETPLCAKLRTQHGGTESLILSVYKEKCFLQVNNRPCILPPKAHPVRIWGARPGNAWQPPGCSGMWLLGPGVQLSSGAPTAGGDPVGRICQFPWCTSPTWSISNHHMASLSPEVAETPHGLQELSFPSHRETIEGFQTNSDSSDR